MLNEYNEQTKGVIHLAVTTLCDRACPNCCNNSYTWDEVPYATTAELSVCHTICITGGEPFSFANPCMIARQLRKLYPNIKHVYVYTNAAALHSYLKHGGLIHDIDGVTISIKSTLDYFVLDVILPQRDILELSSNIVYDMSLDELEYNELVNKYKMYKIIKREWQENFVPDPNSVFRKL